jgi:hypothetical protein
MTSRKPFKRMMILQNTHIKRFREEREDDLGIVNDGSDYYAAEM